MEGQHYHPCPQPGKDHCRRADERAFAENKLRVQCHRCGQPFDRRHHQHFEAICREASPRSAHHPEAAQSGHRRLLERSDGFAFLRTLCSSTGFRRSLQFALYPAKNCKQAASGTIRHGCRLLYAGQRKAETDPARPHRSPGVDARKRPQQSAAGQRHGRAARFRHVGPPPIRFPQCELWRRLCHGA